MVKIAKEEFGHMTLLAVFDVVDDTKFVQKVILDVRSSPLSILLSHGKKDYSALYEKWTNLNMLSCRSRIFRGRRGDFENPTRTEGVFAYGRFLCICGLRRGHN